MKKQKIVLLVFIFFIIGIVSVSIYFTYFTSSHSSRESFSFQQTKIYDVSTGENKPLDILATILPQFHLNINDKKFSNLWEANAQESKEIESKVVDFKGDQSLDVETKIDNETKKITITPKPKSGFKPGFYQLNVKVKTYKGENITITQDFTWGVIAINTDKAVYKTKEKVNFAMAVLDDFGRTKCIANNGKVEFSTAKISLEIISPSGIKKILSTDDGGIQGSKDCADRSVTYKGDFLANYIPAEIGKYVVRMKTQTLLGDKSMDYSFNVSNEYQPFEIERTKFPTRIFPSAIYPVEITVKANEDYSGKVTDIIPIELGIFDISSNGKLIKNEQFQNIEWNVDFKKGETYKLSYAIKFPRIVPNFYLIGPLKIGEFSEGKEWQVASDTIFQFLREGHNTATSGTSLTATFTSGTATLNNLIVLVCYRDANSTINTPSGYSRAWRITSGAPRMSLFYRLATAGQATGTCSFSNSGSIGAEIMEFSGNNPSLTGLYDSHTGNTSRSSCTTSANTPTITATNPDELVISSFTSTNGSITFSAHTAVTGVGSVGLTDTDTAGGTNGFNDANASFDSAWGEAVNNPATAQLDTVTLSASGGTCSRAISYFNPAITISQGGYRFFDNADSVTPGSALAPTNTTMQLGFPNYPFRIRVLFDIDSPGGTTLGLQAGDFILQYATLSASFATCDDIVQWDPVSSATSQSDIAFYINPGVSGSGANISATGSDPSDGGYSTVLQSYYQDDTEGPNGPNPGNITNDQNTLSNNQAGLWDLSLVDNTDDTVSRHYCLRFANSDGSSLDAYRNYPQVITVQTDVTIRGGTTINGATTIR